MKLLTALTPLALSALAVNKPANSSVHRPTAALDSGPVVGVATELPNAIAPVNKFLGIPYASPPERFCRGRKPEPWTEPLNVSEFGPACRQLFVDNELGPGSDLLRNFYDDGPPENEDCLYINAFAPSSLQPPEGRPVVLFIHGGGWQQGHGRIDMSGFAAYEDVVAFSFNYRTNLFGFPNAPGIPTEETNLGLYDQRLALEWVQANAGAFGGDPSKVTVWGESAGSMSVDIHANAYGDARPPPFRAAIMFSGQISVGLLGSTADPADTRNWDAVARAAGCGDAEDDDQLSCMRAVSADALVAAMATAQAAFTPVVDNVTLPGGRAARWRAGENARVPVLMGTIAQEGRGLVSRHVDLDVFLDAYLPRALVTREQRERIVDVYRGDAALQSDFDVAAAMQTDYLWQCPQRILANISASVGNPTWRYYFNASVTSLVPAELAWLGKFHGSDLVLLFGAPTFEADGVPLTPQLYTFGSYLRGVVGRFVRNPQGGPGWPAVGSRFAPFDVANLGDVGGEEAVAGATVVEREGLDARCALYEGIYPLLDQYVLS
ncbi:hypothetical protein AK830_g5762 [Neonectria ditissima]|uniref:Carboxylic ester hydrolase n=1 Tax=Neonectria ditissima TaxID=78410 RepID=A0A0P7B350_9HYPO|nr:hypothetical protein AK830_g5762 [Neonectria ditissima]